MSGTYLNSGEGGEIVLPNFLPHRIEGLVLFLGDPVADPGRGAGVGECQNVVIVGPALGAKYAPHRLDFLWAQLLVLFS